PRSLARRDTRTAANTPAETSTSATTTTRITATMLGGYPGARARRLPARRLLGRRMLGRRTLGRVVEIQIAHALRHDPARPAGRHRDAVQHVGGFHRSLLVRHDEQLGLIAELVQQ